MTSIRISGSSGLVHAPGTPPPSTNHANLSAPAELPVAELGLAGMIALLVQDSAKQSEKLAHDEQRIQENEQISALNDQATATQQKAEDIKAEGVMSAATTIAGGVITIASVSVMPSVNDSQNAAQWAADGEKYGHAYSVVSAGCQAQLASQRAMSDAVKSFGGTVTQLGQSVGRATYAADETLKDAAATRAAADAKFHESARDEYSSMARDAKDVEAKVAQFLEGALAERQAAMRGILRSA